ncbi:hypothetical protein SNE40_017028 [Patella caerulea]|uniref:IgGFc-binding protein N-terminal domain-containing protein n=1 Tax=Patella caerulea TaxID=87958 RepID=A0AAN8PDB4_PATCE
MDHWGTNFVLSFLRNVDNAANRIVVTTRELTDVTITFHEGTGDIRVFQLLAGESRTETFGFDSTAYPPLTVLTNKAITVESTAKVSVYGLSYVKRSTDGFLALPTPSLGMDYMAVNIDDDRSQIVIVAVQDMTNVKVTLKTETNNACWENDNWYYYNDGVVLELNMMSHDVVNVYCSRETTGSRIESNKPIAVLSGNKCASLPDLALCDHVVEMLPPIAEFGLEFVVPAPSGQRYGAMLRVVALYDVTSFDIKGTNHNIDSRRYTDVKLSQSDVFCFTSNKPVLVVLFMIGKDDDNHDDIYDGDAFLMLIPPVNKYTTEYVFKGNLLGYYTNKAMIIAHRDDTNYISPSVSAFEIIANCDYRVKTVLVNNVKTVTSTKPFAVLQYGYEFREAYGFPAGMRITSYDGKGYINRVFIIRFVSYST